MIPIPGARVLDESNKEGRCNLTLVVGEGDGAKVLKIFRRRRSALREVAGEVCARIIHRKRGLDVRCRYETELRSIRAWTRHGFDVPRILDLPLPEETGGMAIWYEYCAGRLLSAILADKSVPWGEKAGLLKRLGAQTDRRHAAALEHSERLLIQEFGHVKHVMVWKDRMITFDFEQAFCPGFNLWEALADEMSGVFYSMGKVLGAEGFDSGVRAFIGGYAARDRLVRIVRRGAAGWGPRRLMKRLAAVFRRSDRAKIASLRRVLELLTGAPTGLPSAP